MVLLAGTSWHGSGKQDDPQLVWHHVYYFSRYSSVVRWRNPCRSYSDFILQAHVFIRCHTTVAGRFFSLCFKRRCSYSLLHFVNFLLVTYSFGIEPSPSSSVESGLYLHYLTPLFSLIFFVDLTTLSQLRGPVGQFHCSTCQVNKFCISEQRTAWKCDMKSLDI